MFNYIQTKDKENDIVSMLICNTQVGAKNCTDKMRPYVWSREASGVFMINLAKTWEKLMIAARIIAAINPAEVLVVATREFSQRPVLKFAQYTHVKAVASKWVPGMLTNQITKNYHEPRLMIVSDPRLDTSAVKEASYMNVPVIAFCDTDSPLENIDIVIPCNTKNTRSIALMYWLLAKEVLYLKGILERGKEWDVMMDLFIHRTQKDVADYLADRARKEREDEKKGEGEEDEEEEEYEEEVEKGEGEADAGAVEPSDVKSSDEWAGFHDKP